MDMKKLEHYFISGMLLLSSALFGQTGPGGIDSNLTLWLDAKSGVEMGGIPALNSNQVDKWVNKSANLNIPDLNQVTNNLQPIFNTLTLNYNPVVTFDGANDKLVKEVLGSDLFDISNNTIVMVHRYNAGVVYFKWEQGPSGNRVGYENSGNNVRFDFPTDGGGNQTLSNFNYDPKGQIVTATTIPGSSTLRNMGLIDITSNTSGSLNNTFTSQLSIGDNVSFSLGSNMDYAEIIVYNRTLSAVEINKVESYLAIKYGMTLGVNGVSLNYNSANGTTIWDIVINNGYNFDIIGVSRDDNSEQDQRKSKSINLNGGNDRDILTLSNGLDFSNPSQFATDESFLTAGHNDGTLTNTGVAVSYSTDNGQTMSTVFDRKWKSQETGTVADVTLEFDMTNSTIELAAGVTNYNNVRLLVDEDGDFSNGATAYSPTSIDVANNLIYFQHDFMPTNGNSLTQNNGFFFTLASIELVVANFAMNDSTICVGETIVFSDSSYTTPMTWSWTFNGGDVTTANTQGPHSITFSLPGTYNINLLVTDANSSDDSTLQVVVNDFPTINAGLNDTVCDGENYTLTGVNPDGAILTWNNNITDNIEFTPINTSEYIITALLNECESTDTVIVVVNPNPELIVPSNFSICDGEEAILNATTMDADDITWNNNIINNQSFVPVGTLAYIGTATITDGTIVCTTTDIVTVTVEINPIVNAQLNGDTLITLCQGDSYTLIADNPDNGILTWTNSVVDNVEFTPIDSLMYYVTSNFNGCIGMDSIIIDIVESPTVQTELDQRICYGDSVLLNAITNEPLATLTWNLGQVNNTYTNPIITQTYTVTVSLGSCSSTGDITITVMPLPDAGFSYIPNPITVENTEVEFTQFNTFEGEVYIWDFSDGGSSSIEAPIHVYPEIGDITYSVQLTVIDSIGCVDSSNTQVTIFDVIVYYIPNAFTPDSDDFNETFQPVFTSGFDPQDYHLMIFNRWGEIIFESYNHGIGWDGTYNGKIVQDGVYVWTVEFGELISDKRIVDTGTITLLR
jgi:gliding motility-associated-like protein